MNKDALKDHELFKKLIGRLVRNLERHAPIKRLEKNDVYRCYHSIEYFQEKYPDPESRREYIQQLESLRDDVKECTQTAMKECMPLFLDEQQIGLLAPDIS